MPAQHASAPTFCCATLKAIAIGNTDNSRPLSPAPAHNFPRSEPNCSGRPSSARRLVGATVPRPACSTLSPVLLRAHAHRQQQLRKPCGVHVPLQEGAQQRLVRALSSLPPSALAKAGACVLLAATLSLRGHAEPAQPQSCHRAAGCRSACRRECGKGPALMSFPKGKGRQEDATWAAQGASS